MELKIIFGQRNESYPGEYAPEALHVMTEFDYAENPDWIHNKLEEEKKEKHWERVEVITITVSESAIMQILRPYLRTVPGTVED